MENVVEGKSVVEYNVTSLGVLLENKMSISIKFVSRGKHEVLH